MDHLHRAAQDVLSVRLQPLSRVLPPSRHALLQQAPIPTAASSQPPACQGTTLHLLVREQPDTTLAAVTPLALTSLDAAVTPTLSASTASSGGGVRLWPARVSSWCARDWNAPHAVPLEWIGVELSNIAHSDDAIFALHSASLVPPPRLLWRTQQYLVRDGPARGSPQSDLAERALDSSLSLRWRTASSPSPIPSPSPSLPPSLLSDRVSSHLTAHVGVVTDLGAAVKPRAVDAPSSAASLVSANISVGFESAAAAIASEATAADPAAKPRLHLTNQWSVQAFGSGDGNVVGGNALKSFRWRSHDGDLASAISALTGVTCWPASLPRLQLCASSVGIEYARVMDAKDFTAGFGVQHQFRWMPALAEGQRDAPSHSASSSSPAAVRPAPPAPLLPPATVSLSATAMGHLHASLHAPLTRSLVTAAKAHLQLTNGESTLQLGAHMQLNEAQSVGIAVDSVGGVRAAISTRRRHRQAAPPAGRGISSAFAWMSWLSRHAQLQLHVQAFPLLPALIPAWNVPQSSVMGSLYSREGAIRLQRPQMHVGASLQFDLD